jgi:hypothetical protein
MITRHSFSLRHDHSTLSKLGDRWLYRVRGKKERNVTGASVCLLISRAISEERSAYLKPAYLKPVPLGPKHKTRFSFPLLYSKMQLLPLDPRPSSPDVIMIELHNCNRFNSFLGGRSASGQEGCLYESTKLNGSLVLLISARINSAYFPLIYTLNRELIAWLSRIYFVSRNLSCLPSTYLYVT